VNLQGAFIASPSAVPRGLPRSPLLLPTRTLKKHPTRRNNPDLNGAGPIPVCKQGHELTAANLRTNAKGRRYCRTCKALYARTYGKRDVHFEELTAIRARAEAQALFRMIGRNGETAESIRDLILVDRDSLKALLAFLEIEPKEFRWVMESLRFRDLVLEKFNQLTK
jgi:hypothetical protein